MSKEFNFKNLFIFDLANNHQGDVEHALKIIRGVGGVVSETGIRAALKFQFRQIDSFIHPDFKDKKDIKHIPRFISTALSTSDYRKLIREVRKQAMHTICTPFDEESVDLIMKMDIDVIKIASCSALDWPLLEKVSETGKPVVLSTAGVSTSKIDRIVSFLEYKDVDFALMHCVAIYPTPDEQLNLNQIGLLKERYPQHPVGYSTHENPDNYESVKIAYAKGATLFERHVGLNTEKYSLNAYSSEPENLKLWIDSYLDAVTMCGGEHRAPAYPGEIASLRSLMRGVYAAKDIRKGQTIKRSDVFFAMPLQEKQLTSGQWLEDMKADKNYKALAPISEELAKHEIPREAVIYQIMLQVKGMLNKASIFIGGDSSIEISHHYGLERFREFGCVIIDCINREYCKKLIIQLPRQKHPYHYHAKKEESFQLLYGDLEIELEGRRRKMKPGDIALVEKDVWHKFHTLDGAVFEEVSTTHFNDDSFYEDEKIAKLPREARKTEIPNWEAVVADNF